MRIARDAYFFLIPLLVLAALSAAAGFWVPTGILVALAAFVAFFFRDPDRDIPSDPTAVVSPADGKVIKVEETPEGKRICIFLSVFDVHVNRAPVDGTVTRCLHRPGKFLLAWDDRASAENEQLVYEIGGVTFALIAGLVARRIIPWRLQGETVRKGDRIALIRFGSRVDLLAPPGSEVVVSAGERVKAGSSILARWSRSH